MNKFWKTGIVACVACVSALALTGCSSLNKDDVVATMNGETEVKLGEAVFWLRYNQISTESMLSMFMGTTDVWDQDLFGSGEVYGDTFKDGIMDDIKEMLILEAHASEYGVELSAEDEEAIAQAAQEFLDANDEKTLEEMYADSDTVYRMLSLATIRERMKTAIEKEADTAVSDEEAAQKKIEYAIFSTADTTDDDGNTVEMTDEEKEEVKAQAQQLIDSVNAGETMEDAINEIDEDKTTLTTTYGTDSSLSEELTTAADTLSDGEIYAEPIEFDSGYYVVQMVSTFDEEATEEEKADIISERQDTLYSEALEEWEPDSFEINEKIWDKIGFEVSLTEPTEAETDTEAASETETGTEEVSETETGTEAESVSETETGTETESVSETETESETASETEEEETEAGSESESESET